ncbi:MAG: hypothetical protein HFJ28_00240 [Clostridia bacterium]|nr:hypothetical protein [Clostridia bacterium]
MENASRALVIAGSVLIGVLLLSIGVYIFTMYGDYSKSIYEKIEDAKNDQFNSQFLKYYGSRTDNNNKEETILCTAHDIISIANLAKQNNVKYEFTGKQTAAENSYYIQISVDKQIGYQDIKNMETWDNDRCLEFMKENALHEVYLKDENGQYILENGNKKIEKQPKNYICTEVKVSNITKRVYYMKFEHKKELGVCVGCH